MRRRVFALVGAGCVALIALCGGSYVVASQATSAPWRQATPTPASPRTSPLRPVASRPVTPPAVAPDALVKQYCVTCHNQRLKTAGLALDGMDYQNIPAAAEAWEKVTRKVRAGQMPPAGVPRPPQAALNGLVAQIGRASCRERV